MIAVRHARTCRSRFSPARTEPLELRRLLSITPTLVEVPISAAAIAADPSLANYKSYDLRVIVSAGDRWASGDMKAVLTSGHFYEPPSFNSNIQQSALWPFLPNLEFDTFVATSDGSPPNIMASYAPPGAFGSAIFTATETNVTWGNGFGAASPGVFTTARLTVSDDAVGTFVGKLGDTAWAISPQQFSWSLPLPAVRGEIHGFVYLDRNGNGVLDDGQTDGGVNTTVYLDANDNGSLDAGEATALSINGGYVFSGLDAGTYHVRAVLNYPFLFEDPANSGRTVTLASSTDVVAEQNIAMVLVGNGDVSGRVLKDVDRDGVISGFDTGLTGVTVYLDADDNGQLDDGEATAVSSSTGQYQFHYVPDGEYFVRQIVPNGLYSTGAESHFIQIGSSSLAYGDLNFLDAAPAVGPTTGSLRGVIFNDANVNNVRDPDESAQSFVRVYLDNNDNDVFDAGELSTTSSTSGFSFANLAPGTYHLKEVLPTGYRHSTTAPWAYVVNVVAGQDAGPYSFANTQKVFISGNVVLEASCGTREPSNDKGLTPWIVYIDKNDNGVLDLGEQHTVTGARGAWSFDNLTFGTYVIRVLGKTGYVATTPARLSVTLARGETSTGLLFGQKKIV